MEKKNKTSQPTKNPILIMHRVYLTPTGLRADCRVLYHNNTMSTPWGKVKTICSTKSASGYYLEVDVTPQLNNL